MEGPGARGGLTLAQYDIEIGGRVRRVAVARAGSGFAVTVDGRSLHVDAVRVGEHLLSLLVDGASFEAAVAANVADGTTTVTVDGTPVTLSIDGRRRWSRKDDHGGAGGPQRLSAPMPGKVVRVLVAKGEAVRARQPLVVVEAMKMENELRAVRDGVVADVQVREGQSVDAGTLLVVVQS